MPEPFASDGSRTEPNEAAAQNEIGLRFFDSGKPQQALACFEKAVALDPGFKDGYRNQGIALQALKRLDEAISAYRKALDLDPAAADTQLRLGQLYAGLRRNEEAHQCFLQAAKHDPNNARTHVLLAWILPKVGDIDGSEAHLRKAIELDPTSSVAYGMLGFRLQESGRFEEAIANFERGISLNRRQAGSYYGLTHSRTISELDQHLVAAMNELLQEGGFQTDDIVFLRYALGKALNDLGDYEHALSHYDEANRISVASSSKPYDRKGYNVHVDRTIALFTKEFFARHRKVGLASDRPVFIVGMPRSGTTLVEQVLSCHSEIGPGGELPFWQEKTGPLQREIEKGNIDGARLRQTVNQYLRQLESMHPGKRFVTDKMPINFMFLGVIHLAFPNARIVHCRRNPVDTCLSIYMTRNVTPPEFANDRANIVFGYRQYSRLMDHWRKVIPADNFLELDYENLVRDRENVTRGMIEFLGLSWEDACMHPEGNERTIRTPSMWQVRQPVHLKSVARWKHYEPWLGVFRELMGE